MGNAPLFSRNTPGGNYLVVDESITTGDIWFVDSGHASASDAAGYGKNPDAPFSTIDYAIGKCTANNGDVIYVAPGHAESVVAAGGIALDVAGVSIFGLGHGDLRPTVTFATSAAASVAVTGADCRVRNIRFVGNIASQNHMIDVAADDFLVEDCEFLEGSATGLSFITADTSDADSDNLTVRRCKFYAPTAGNFDAAIQVAKDHTGIRIENCRIYGDFDEAGVDLPAGGDACVNIQIVGNEITNLQSGQHAIQINGAAVTGIIRDNRVQTDALATSIDSSACSCFGNLWVSSNGSVDEEAIPANGLATGSSNPGTVAGTRFTVTKTFTSSSIPNNTQTGGALTGASSGALLLEEITVNTDGTGFAAPTNIEFSTDNTKGVTGAAGPIATEVIASFGANKTVVVTKDATSHTLPYRLESGKKVFIHGDDAAGTGGGTGDITLVFMRLSDGATIAAST